MYFHLLSLSRFILPSLMGNFWKCSVKQNYTFTRDYKRKQKKQGIVLTHTHIYIYTYIYTVAQLRCFCHTSSLNIILNLKWTWTAQSLSVTCTITQWVCTITRQLNSWTLSECYQQENNMYFMVQLFRFGLFWRLIVCTLAECHIGWPLLPANTFTF